MPPHVAVGSKGEVTAHIDRVRFAPDNGNQSNIALGRRSAKRILHNMHCGCLRRKLPLSATMASWSRFDGLGMVRHLGVQLPWEARQVRIHFLEDEYDVLRRQV
jgi:hypothetical protein